MTEKIPSIEENGDSGVIERLAREISEDYDSGFNKLISIKIDINPKHHLANIFACYLDKSRERQAGSEDNGPNYLEHLIEWPHFESLENTEEAWNDLSFPTHQTERARLLSERLKSGFDTVILSDDLKYSIKDGKAFIERV